MSNGICFSWLAHFILNSLKVQSKILDCNILV